MPLMALSYDELGNSFDAAGPLAGLEALIATLQKDGDHHALFRALLLKKRYQLGLPLINPGDLKDFPEQHRKEYEDFVAATCREIGAQYLKDGDIAQAWRYFRTVGDSEPVRAALEKLDPKDASDDALNIAIEQGAHPRRGFELTLARDGLCRAISVFEAGFSDDLSHKKFAAALLARALYKDLVVGVSRAILDRFGQLPPPEETDLVELIRHRPWLFENKATHADPQHVAAVARIGLICEAEEDLIMALSIAEYGRLLDAELQPVLRAPFEDGFADVARFARALLGQGADETADYFRARLHQYGTGGDTYSAELAVLLLWRMKRHAEALDVWQEYLREQPAELPGALIPSYYQLCIEAREFRRLADAARAQDDSSAWAAARLMDTGASPGNTVGRGHNATDNGPLTNDK